jgi:hypothetical protein
MDHDGVQEAGEHRSSRIGIDDEPEALKPPGIGTLGFRV